MFNEFILRILITVCQFNDEGFLLLYLYRPKYATDWGDSRTI